MPHRVLLVELSRASGHSVADDRLSRGRRHRGERDPRDRALPRVGLRACPTGTSGSGGRPERRPPQRLRRRRTGTAPRPGRTDRATARLRSAHDPVAARRERRGAVDPGRERVPPGRRDPGPRGEHPDGWDRLAETGRADRPRRLHLVPGLELQLRRAARTGERPERGTRPDDLGRGRDGGARPIRARLPRLAAGRGPSITFHVTASTSATLPLVLNGGVLFLEVFILVILFLRRRKAEVRTPLPPRDEL